MENKLFKIIIATITQGTGNIKGSPAPLGLTSYPMFSVGKNRGEQRKRQALPEHTQLLPPDHFVSWKVAHCTWPEGQKMPLFSSPDSHSRSEWLGLNREGWQASTPTWLISLYTRGIGGGETQQKRTRRFLELGLYWVLASEAKAETNKTTQKTCGRMGEEGNTRRLGARTRQGPGATLKCRLAVWVSICKPCPYFHFIL